MRNLLITGGAGFIGTNFVQHYLGQHPDHSVLNLDKLTYAGNLENLSNVENQSSYQFVKGDINDRGLVRSLFAKNQIDTVINFAAESHVDRSILDATPFIDSNVCGTLSLLDTAFEYWKDDFNAKKFIQISTDEVYGELGTTGLFDESTSLAPNSPYSASKASADLLCRAYFRTYDFPVIVTRCSNNYGPYQFPEKLIPLMIFNAYRDIALPVYGDGRNVRDWIHVLDHCRAICLVLENGVPGEVYNIGGECELENIYIVKTILSELDKPESLIKYVKDRPGHDRRYAIDCSKLKDKLGWVPEIEFKSGIRSTIQWYLDRMDWMKQHLNQDYLSYVEMNYKDRMIKQ